jgi:type II secretory pathway pseudopilin PulG
MIVMAIIAVLMSVALPIYNRSIIRAKESVLKIIYSPCARSSTNTPITSRRLFL